MKSKFKTKFLSGAAHNSLPSSTSDPFSSYLSNQNSKVLQILTDNNHLINTNHKIAANHQANRYRQSASPARQRLVAGGSLLSSSGKLGSTGSQLSVFGRNSKRNMLPPYRTHQTGVHKALPIGGSMQNVSPLAYKPPRRSSASAGICNENQEKAPSNYRSCSVDGLVDNGESTDKKIAEAAALVSAGSLALTNASSTSTLQPNEDYNCSTSSITELQSSLQLVKRREKPATLPPINPQHRKSRSLDHFLDEQTLAAIVAPPSPTEGTQSMQNLATPMTPEPIRSGIGLTMRATSVRDSKSTTPEPVTALRSSPSSRRSPEGISSTEDEREDSQSIKSIKTSHIPAAAPKSQTRAAAHVHRGNSTNTKRLHGGEQNGRVAKTTSSSSLGSTSGAASSNNKTIFNRTMKKVRSLIKK